MGNVDFYSTIMLQRQNYSSQLPIDIRELNISRLTALINIQTIFFIGIR